MKVFEAEPVFNKTVLDCGVTVVTEHHPSTRAVSVGCFVPCGTRDEEKSMVGASHFVEHMVFKGTKKRSAFDIVASLEAVGGDLNAYTSREYVCLHATALREHLSLSLDVLVDLLVNAKFTPEEFEKERQVISAEIDMSADDIEEYVFDLYFEKAFDRHSLSYPILGTQETLKQMTNPKLKKFYKNQFSGSDLIVSVAGHVDHDEACKLVEKALGKKPQGTPRKRRRKAFAKSFGAFKSRPSEQVHILFGNNAAPYKSPRRFDAYILNAVLGGGMTSRLYQKIREDKGLVYSVYSYLHSFTDSGLSVVYAGTSPENVNAVLQMIAHEFEKIHDKGLPKKDIQFFQRQVKGQILLGADDIENRMNSLGVNEMVFGKYRPVSEVLEEIDAVSQESIQQYMKDYMDPTNCGLYLLGDIPHDVAHKHLEKYVSSSK